MNIIHILHDADVSFFFWEKFSISLGTRKKKKHTALTLRHSLLALGLILFPQQFTLQLTSDWLADVGQMRSTELATDLRAEGFFYKLVGAAPSLRVQVESAIVTSSRLQKRDGIRAQERPIRTAH